MGDDAPFRDPSITAGAYLRAIEELRADVREDLARLRDEVRHDNAALEARVIEHVVAVRDDLKDDRRDRVDYVLAHGREHEDERRASFAEHETFRQFIREFELTEARRAGAIGVFRYGIELTSRHAPRLATLLVPILAFLLALLGNVRVSFGVGT